MENALEVRVGKYLGYLATDPDNPHLILETAQMLNRLGRFPEALDLIEHGQSVTPDDPALAFTKSTVALSSNNPGLAIEILENLVASGNDNGAIRYNLAYSLALQGEMEKAQAVIEPSLSEIEPKTPEVLILLARIKHYLGDIEDAIKLIESFLLNYPDHNQLGQAQGILALLALDTQDLQSARMHAAKSLSTDPNNPDSLVTMGSIALEEFDSNSAKNHFDKVLAQHPTNGRAWLGTGLAYMLDQELGKAEDALTQCVEHMPTHLGSWNTLAWCQIAQNKIDRAENTLLKARLASIVVAFRPTMPKAYSMPVMATMT